MKFHRALAAAVLAAALVASCGSGKDAKAPAKTLRVAYIINGSLGDQSFYDSGQAGIDRIKAEFGAETTTIETSFDPAKYPQALQSAVQWKADVIFVISYGFEDLVKEYADQHPEIAFINIDTVVQNSKNTITNVDFFEEEGAFMAGVAAGIVTLDASLPGSNPEKIVGAVGGDVDPVIQAFIFGYTQGAKYVDKDIEVKTIYAGTWEDPVRGKQAAKQLYAQKADIVFQIASLTGSGVLEAAAEEKKYAIGVDSNQNGLQPGYVVTSDLKNVGDAIYSVFLTIKDGSYKPGVVISSGLAQGGVGLAIDDNTKAILKPEQIQRLMDVEAQIKSGAIVVEPYKP